MKTFLTFIALLTMVPSFTKASTVTLSSAATGPSVFASNALNLVPNGSLIRVGTFLGGVETAANWRDFGPSTVKTAGIGGGARASKVTGAVTNTGGEADDAQFNGLAVYIWIYNSVAVSLTADQAIFKSNAFVFPNNDLASAGDAVTPTAVSFTQSIALEGFTPGLFLPNADNGTGNLTGGKFVLGAAIPEISTSMMLISLLGLVVVRRRR